MPFFQQDPVQGEKYTVERMQAEIDSEYRTYSPTFTFAELNSAWAIEKNIVKFHDLFSNPLFVILENRRSGATVCDYSNNDNNFSVSGFTSGEIQTTDYAGIGYRNGAKEPYSMLEFDSLSWLYCDALNIADTDFTFGINLIRLGSGAGTIVEKEDCFLLDINASGYVSFTVYGTIVETVVVHPTAIQDLTEHRIVARYDSGAFLHLDIDGESESEATEIDALHSVSGNVIIGGNIALDSMLTGYLRDCFLEQSLISDANLETLESKVLPYGYEICDYYYDDEYGSGTTEAYGFSGYLTRHPYRRYFYGANFAYNSGSGLTITEVIA